MKADMFESFLNGEDHNGSSCWLDDCFGFDHVISGRLLCGGLPVAGKQVVVKVNGTAVRGVTTAGDGSYSVTLNLKPVDNKPTNYQIEAVFYGDNALNLTLTDTTPNGTAYAVCTTIQYGLRPFSNSTTLIVGPQSTHVLGQTKTPEEMQQEAEQSGWFRVEPEFSWWYPWFRLHYKLNVNLSQGNPNIDYGWALLPFGESYTANSAVLANVMNDATEDNDPYALLDFMVPVILQFGTALVFGCTLISAAIAIAGYAAYSSIRACQLYLTNGNNPKVWLIAFITSLITATSGLAITGVSSGLKAVYSLLTSTSRFVLGKIESIWHSMIAKSLGFFAIVGAAFALLDFAFMVFYLTMYLSSV